MLSRLLHFFSGRRLAFSLACVWPTAAMVAVLTSSGFAQTDREHQAYVEAVIRLTQQGESASLERFVLTSESGSLKRNGLEWLVAHSLRRRNAAQAKTFAEQLLSREPDNALALAVSSNAVTQSVIAGSDIENTIDMAKRALQKMPELKAPELMQQGEFSALKDQLISSLNGAVGYAYYERKDYLSARTYLRSAATLAQENARYAYALAICDLFGRDGDEAEGYRLLARTVNLTKGTPAGEELAKFARQNYLERGGSNSDWDRYLTNTRSPAASVAASAAERRSNLNGRRP
jgi:tetratricopeptide (TPR) repeat protein